MTPDHVTPPPTLPVMTGPRVGASVRWRRMLVPTLAGAGVALATVALHLRDPHQQGSWGLCPTVWIFGFDCPACGGLRAVHDLTDGNLLAALSSNLLVVLAIPVVLGFWVRRLLVTWRGGEAMRPLTVPTWVWWTGGVVLLVFTVLRNTAVGAWFAP